MQRDEGAGTNSPMPPSGLSLSELATRVGAAVEGDGSVVVSRVGTLDDAGPGAITFFSNPRLRHQLAATRAAAVIVAPADVALTTLPRLVHANPYATYARVATLLHPTPRAAAGTHPTASIDASAQVDPSASIGPYVVVGARARIGARVRVGAHSIVGDDVVLGDDVDLVMRVTLYPRSILGARTIVHAGAVIGADGFGNAEEGGRWIKIPQVGRVVIGADCEIGANTTVDRGAIADTVLEDDVKLDNQIQIGHNCRIGAHTAVAGCVGIAGSCIIGRNVKIGGAAMIAGHITIADGAIVSAATGVFASIPDAGVYTGTFPALPHREWQQVAAQMRRLRQLGQRVVALERELRNRGRAEEEGE
jgi:UDP-3-O-[3-hydroxymyristoyl] glucosamine N-acyltransferase